MKFIKSKKPFHRLYLFVSAIDQSVIARPNFKITESCWDQLPTFIPESNLGMIKINESSLFQHLVKTIETEKYSFLYNTQMEKNLIIQSIAEIELPPVYFKELEWLKRFGYYFQHSLAITILISAYNLEMKLNRDFISESLEASLIHDIGLTRLPYNILFSHDLFQDDDKLLMNQHSLISYLLVGYYSGRQKCALGQTVLYHHSPEKIDDFVNNRRKNQIKKMCWMIYNMGIFDALISHRPFRPAYKVENALFYLKQVNQSLNLPLDIVNWLEKKLNYINCPFIEKNLLPYNPELDLQQLN
jgi:HD-GYP domain-containing protein (c-di-GMP phosphodiesterase class II)